MDQYCKTILKEYSAGRSILEVCSAGGMPSIVEVKKWLFNREYDYEYRGFREEFLRIQMFMLYLYHDTIQYKLDLLKDNIVKNKYGQDIICPKVAKDFRDYSIAVRWFSKHLELLQKLYDHHARGLDFPIEGIHFEAILAPPKELDPECRERKPPADFDFSSFNFNWNYDISSSITRAEAEALLGTPLLYGRIHKRIRRKPIRKSGTKLSPEQTQISIPNPIYPNPQTQTPTHTSQGSPTPVLPLSESQFAPCLPFKIPIILDSS